MKYFFLGWLVIGLLTGGRAQAAGAAKLEPANYYPYQGEHFHRLLEDSFQAQKQGEAKDFYLWMDKAFQSYAAKTPGGSRLTLRGWLGGKKTALNRLTDKEKKSAGEIALGAELHKMIKTTIPRFSLERGFEFCNVINCGERQCFLQAVLIAGLLQEAGAEAGVVMVYRNIQGATSNNGHAVTLLKLPDGKDLIVDASEPEPFPRQQGLFAKSSDYIYLTPRYEGSSPKIIGYQAATGGRKLTCRQVGTLDFAFLRSQFYYYRGERAPGGILANPPTSAGLKASVQALATSVALCPNNPLAVYMLGRGYYAQGNLRQARGYLAQAEKLYARFGWSPASVGEYRALAEKGKPASLND